ncbi:hypothetical protein O3P69_014966 [Scylla paramamosain]|uniref:Ig-like domain-containing protein n=1 Tax=Scylla paramamosain TaxID=85552 RepID=A0AAW0SK58_SCYPA
MSQVKVRHTLRTSLTQTDASDLYNYVVQLLWFVWSVTGVAGRASDLPCYLNPRTPGDRPKLILWYKRGIRTPVFSHDGRVPQMRSDVNQNGGTLTVSRGAATLTLHNLTLAHGGVYECRVDFFKSPTHTNFVNLTVVESPSSVEVVDGRGGRARGGVLGPYLEDSSLSLTCIAKGGSPLPNVTWWREDRLLSEKWHLKAPNQVENELWVEKLTREWINTSLTCVAANTHLANPVSVTVKVDMYLLPTSVIVINPGPAREGEKMRLLCTSTGSRPSANLTWTVRGVTRSAQKECTIPAQHSHNTTHKFGFWCNYFRVQVFLIIRIVICAKCLAETPLPASKRRQHLMHAARAVLRRSTVTVTPHPPGGTSPVSSNGSVLAVVRRMSWPFSPSKFGGMSGRGLQRVGRDEAQATQLHAILPSLLPQARQCR